MTHGAPTVAVGWLLWRRFTVRHWTRSPGASITLCLILAIGVAAFFAIRLANRSAVAGFAQFSATLTGEADLVLTGDAGRLPTDALSAVRECLGERPAAIVALVEGTAGLPATGDAEDEFDARQVEVVGVDLIAIQNLRYVRGGATRPSAGLFAAADNLSVGRTNEVYLTQRLADELQVEAGGTLAVVLGDRLRRLEVAAVVAAEAGGGLPDRLLIMDLPALQALIDRRGWVDRIEVFLPASPDPAATLAAAERALRAGGKGRWQIESAATRKASARQMTAAFRANLTVLSGLALLVGVYLILQALEAAVVRRRPEIATLRSLGVEARSIRLAWLLESATFGVVGTGVGLALGYAGAQLAVKGAVQTVNALYLSTEASGASWDWGEAGLACLLGIGASLLAGILPARDAAETPPAQVLKQGTPNAGIKLLDHPGQGVLLLIIGYFLLKLPPVEWSGKTRFPLAGYGGAVCWLLGASVIVGAFFPLVARLLRSAGDRSAVWRVAVSQFRRPSGRHKLTVAGLVVAVSMASGMGILIHSFERTMQHWIGSNLKADLFVACKGVQNASNRNRIREATWRAFGEDPAVAAVDVGHIHAIRLDGAPTFLAGPRLGRGWSEERFIWLDRRPGPLGLDRPNPDGSWPAYVSESFGHRFRKGTGDRVLLPTPAGERWVEIAGVFADYGNERGSILVDPDQLVAWFSDASAVNVSAYLRPGEALEDVRERWVGRYPGLAIRSHATLRAEILRIFRQTFSITYALKFIGVTVAVAGLVLSLVSLLIERRRELTTLNEVGMSSGQICAAVTVEGAVVALLGLAGGLALSLALGYVLIFVINRQSFGWTLAYAVPWGSTALLGLAVLAAAMISAALVGRWAGRLKGDQEE